MKQFSPEVRLVRNEFDLIVQELVSGEWVDRQTFNEMSDEYAYTNSREFAVALVNEIRQRTSA